MANNNSIIKSPEKSISPQKSENLNNSIIKDMSATRRKHNCMNFAWITNPFETVKDESLRGSGEVYPVHSELLTEAIQNTILIKETKHSLPMRVKTTEVKRPYEKDFRSMFGIFWKHRGFIHVECGKCSMRKDLITVDIDESINVKTFFDKLRNIDNVPECLCTRNKINGHWQIQFHLRNPLYVKRIDFSDKNDNGKVIPSVKRDEVHHNLYIKTIKRCAVYFKKVFKGTDIAYQGTMCRNPYHEMQESYIFKHNRYEPLCNGRTWGINLSDLTDFLDEKKVVLRKNINLEINEPAEMITSRHKLTMLYAREWMWANMRGNYTPSEIELGNYLLEKKYEIAEKCGKEPHTDNEILHQVQSLYEWSVEHYREINKQSRQWKSSVEWNKNQKAAKIKYAKRIKNQVLSMLAADYKISEIAKEYSMSRVTLYSYMALFYAIDLIKTRQYFKNMKMKFGAVKSWDEIIAEIFDIIKILKMKYGESKIKWKLLNYNQHTEDYEYTSNYDVLRLNGNYYLEYRYSA